MEPDTPVEVRRSTRRRRTVSAYERDGRMIVLIPSWFSQDQEQEWVELMRRRLQGKRRRRGDDELLVRAQRLATAYLGGRARPTQVRWVSNQRHRWGSATPAHGTVRISVAVQDMPDWVVDYVILHELAHLIEPGHGPRFWALLSAYPRVERARGYLEGVAAAARLDISGVDVDGDVSLPADGGHAPGARRTVSDG